MRNLQELGINMQKIVAQLLKNQNLLKLLYYNDPDPLQQQDLTNKQIQDEVFNKLIRVIPKVSETDIGRPIVTLVVKDGVIDAENSEVRNIIMDFEIFTPLDYWIIKDNNLRPFAIMGEIQKSLNKKVINGLGLFTCGNFKLSFVTTEISDYILNCEISQYD